MGSEIVKVEKNEVVAAAPNPYGIIEKAIAQGVEPEALEKLLAMQERFEANEARKAYVKAMGAFKAKPPKIIKDTTVEFGTTKYKHAKLAQVTEKVGAAMSEHGLTASWQTDQAENGSISVTCKVTHELGHSESTSLVSAPDNSGGKNSIQAIGSAVSYLQRYTLLAICGLATYDDNDGVANELVDEAQLSTLTDLMAAHDVNESKFMEYWRISELSELWASNFERACTMIQSKPLR